MLDIGFSELVLIGIVALVVIGPERLPRVARTTGHLLGRFQRYVAEVKTDINREMELADLKKIQSSVEDAARSIESSVKTGMQEAEQELRSAEAEVNKAGEEVKKTGSELNQGFAALSMPHMGMGHAAPDAAGELQASAPAAPALDGAMTGTPLAPAETTSPEPSPQLELGLQLPPEAAPAPVEQKQA